MEILKQKLPNGLRVMAVPMQNTETVTLLVLVGTGANYETRATNGLSHFLEHMFFKGTKKYPKPLELDRMLDAVGAVHNAFTSREETGYWIKVDAKHFPLALLFVSEILQNALLKEEEINRERGVILEEINMYRDNPQRQIWAHFEELIYGNNPYGWDVAGSPENVRRIKRSAFLSYWKSQYVAENSLVVVAGNISPEKIFSKVGSAFADLRTGKFARAPEPPKIIPGPRMHIESKDTAQSHVVLGTLGYAMPHKDRIAADVLATILGGYMSSRLFMDIRERRGLAYAVRASHQAYRKVGYFAAYAGVPHGKTAEVVERMIANLQRTRKGGVTGEELTRAKDNIKGHLAISLESTDEVASFVGEQEILLNKVETPKQLIKKLDRVTKEDIRRVAKNLFSQVKTYLTIVGPHQKREQFEKLLKTL
ncbi:MAG TPA: pitrilysin family protein [Candidatus Paceibacterota bacterium]